MSEKNREQWLNEGMELLKNKYFAEYDTTVGRFPEKLRVSVGWCRSKKAIGECWNPECSTEGAVEMFISPKLGEPVEVLACLLHELIHAFIGNDKKHGSEFKELARKFGLAGKLTATYAEPESILWVELKGLAEQLGDYPHKAMMLSGLLVKEPSTKEKLWVRYVSTKIPSYKVVASTRQVDQYGVPRDPLGEEMVVAT